MKAICSMPLANEKIRRIISFALFLCLSGLVPVSSIAQMLKFSHPRVYSEAEFYYDSGKWYSDRLIVKFKPKVVDLPRGRKTTTLTDFAPEFTTLKAHFQRLESKYGNLTFVKRVPRAHWGETLDIDLRTGQVVPISERSQLFTLKFKQLVPIDSLIQTLQGFPEVAYAERPIMTIAFATPNDPKYATQWTLANVHAASAWDVTTGSSAIKIAIVDNGTLQNHEDLQSQIVGGDGSSGNPDPLSTAYGHGTSVTGVAAAHTNNNKGVASLGWNVKLLTYDYTLISHEAAIDSAIRDNADVINMSWGLTEPVEPFSCGGRYWTDKVEPGDRSSIRDLVRDALAAGIVCIAAAGNGSENPGMEGFPQCDPTYPPKSWKPAGYYFTEDKNHNPLNAGVIAVSASHPNDTFRNGWNYDPQQTLPPPATRFMDLAAPGGSDLEAGHADGGYRFVNGTSFAAPMVSALTGLTLSLNSSLSVQQVENIMEQSADKVGQYAYTNDWNRYMGFGRINAYQALLLTHAYSNKSMASTATSSNNGRRLVKDSSGKYHLVFESGITSGYQNLSEIFYRNYTDGTGWSAPIRLSDGNGGNRFPSITERSGKLYVVWQRQTTTVNPVNYDIHYAYSDDYFETWPTKYVLATASFSGATDPMPVIQAGIPGTNTLMVAFRDGAGALTSRYVNNSNPPDPAAWTTYQISSSSSAFRPSLAYRSNESAYFQVTFDGNNNIYHRRFSGAAWGTETNVSSGAALPSNSSSSFAVSASNNRHIVWRANDPSIGNKNVVMHNLNLSPTVFSKFYSSSYHYWSPSISGLNSGGAVVFWHDSSPSKSVRRAVHNGSSWGSYPAGTVYGNNGNEASASVANPPSSPERAVYTSTGSAPYAVTMGEPFQKAIAQDTIVYSRQLVFAGEDSSVLALRLFAPQIVGEHRTLEFPTVANDDSLVATRLADKLSFDLEVRASDLEAKLEVEVYAFDAKRLLQSGASTLDVGFELFNAATNRRERLATVGRVALTDTARLAVTLSLPLSNLRGAQVRIRPVLSGLDLDKVRGALVHEYGAYSIGSRAGEKPLAKTASSSYGLSLRVHPNPFNPSSHIRFALPTAGNVSLRIFEVSGRVVRAWQNTEYFAGEHDILWDGKNDHGTLVASGAYFVELLSGTERKVAKMLLVR